MAKRFTFELTMHQTEKLDEAFYDALEAGAEASKRHALLGQIFLHEDVKRRATLNVIFLPHKLAQELNILFSVFYDAHRDELEGD